MAVNTDVSPMMRAFAAAIMGNVPVVIEDDPGRGKTAKITGSAEKTGWHAEVMVASIREPYDYLGLPFMESGPHGPETTYAAPGFALRCNAADKALLVLDELNTASEQTMKANLRLAQERYAGDTKLGDHVRIVGITNPVSNATGGMELPPAIANRFMHLDWHFDRDEWLSHVATRFKNAPVVSFEDMAGKGGDVARARAAARVTGFLAARPDHHAPPVPDDPFEAGKAWASPRSWSNVIDALEFLDADDDAAAMLVVKGLVGDEAMKAYFAWLQTSDLADPAEVLEDPSIVDWRNERPDRLFTTLSGVEALVMLRGDAKSWEQGMEVLLHCAENGKPDIALVPARTLLAPQFRPSKSKIDMGRVQVHFAELMQRTSNGFASAAA